MKLQNTAVIETPAGLTVEMLFADKPDPEDNEALIQFVVPVSEVKYPRIPEAQLEALRVVRTVIGDEIHRLERIRGQGD